MNNFEIDLPIKEELTLDATDVNLYNYNFSSFSLVSLQKLASESVNDSIRKCLFSNVSNVDLFNKVAKTGEKEYIAKLSDIAKEKINTGEWVLGVRKKTGETYGVLRDTKTGRNKGFLTLDKKVAKGLGSLPELSAIQGQLASVSEGIEDLSLMIQRVEQGQYNDRFSGFFSARQLIIEGLLAKDEFTKKSLLLSAIKGNNETIAKLELAIHKDGLSLADPKTKSKDAKIIDNFLQSSLGFLNSSVQLNLIAYTAIGEEEALFATLTNYHSYINQSLLKEDKAGRSIAWFIDNSHLGDNGNVLDLTNEISNKIQSLIDNHSKIAIKENENETNKNKKM